MSYSVASMTSQILIIISAAAIGIYLLYGLVRNKVHTCDWRLEGIMVDGSIVESCDTCSARRVFVCRNGEKVKLLMYTKAEWESGGSGREVDNGEV